jgi:hypothetical protein
MTRDYSARSRFEAVRAVFDLHQYEEVRDAQYGDNVGCDCSGGKRFPAPVRQNILRIT